MLVIAFTASRTIPSHATGKIDQVLKNLCAQVTDPLFVTGACVGGDQYIASRLLELTPDARQRIVVPRDLSRVDKYWLSAMKYQPSVEIVDMPRGTTYRDRNVALLEMDPGANRLVAFPQYAERDERSARSGSWMTIRFARTRLIPYDAWVLEP